jgi:alcohol dehydrogenase (cytochrome c)
MSIKCLGALLCAAVLAAPVASQEDDGPEGGGRQGTNQWRASEPAGRGAGPVTAETLAASPTRTDWLHFGGNFQSWRYSPIEELTPQALPRLRVAWAGQTGIPGQLEASPVVYDGVLYLTSSHNRVLAYDAADGELLWRYDHQNAKDLRICCGPANRGVAIAGDAVLMGTLDAKLVALDRRTGERLWETTIIEHDKGFSVTSAPLVVGTTAFIGIGGGEYGVRGFFDAYDTRTGERRWRHYTVPAAGEPGVETWAGNSYESGGSPTWVTGSFDPDTGTLFWATGNPSPDWNGDVREGDNLYSDSVLAVDPATGERKWHFQFTPHDVWDYDGNTELFVVDATVGGETVPLVAQANRNGYFYLLDRRDGRFLRATQYVDQVDWGTIDANGRPIVDPTKMPAEENPPRVCPGLAGGNNGAYNSAYSPKTGMIYVPVIESCMAFRKGLAVFIEGVPYVGGGPQRVDTLAGKSYGHLSAIDVATGEIKWRYDDPESMMGGVLTTAGGVVITGNARGHVLGFDAQTGEEVWRFNTGSGIRSHPVAYQLDGRTFLAVGSGGGGGVHYSTGASRMVPEGSTLFVFELPAQ